LYGNNFLTLNSDVYMASRSSSKYNSKSHLFIDACCRDDVEQVCRLLPSMTDDEINSTDSDDNTGLDIACMQSNYDPVCLLLDSDVGKASCSGTVSNKQNINAPILTTYRIGSMCNSPKSHTTLCQW
jgi:ankyrin repeat protein